MTNLWLDHITLYQWLGITYVVGLLTGILLGNFLTDIWFLL